MRSKLLNKLKECQKQFWCEVDCECESREKIHTDINEALERISKDNARFYKTWAIITFLIFGLPSIALMILAIIKL